VKHRLVVDRRVAASIVPNYVAHVSVAKPRPLIEGRELAGIVRVQEGLVLGDELHARLRGGLRMGKHRVAWNGFAAPGRDEVSLESGAFDSKGLAIGKPGLVHEDDGSEVGSADPRVARKDPAERFAEKSGLVELGRELYETNAFYARTVCHHSDVSGIGRRFAWLSAIFAPCRGVEHGHFDRQLVDRR
jgi:hypothetical protein